MGYSDTKLHPVVQRIADRSKDVCGDDMDFALRTYGATSDAYLGRAEWRKILDGISDPHRLEHYGRKVYSQSDEDGIIEEVFRRLGLNRDSGKFIEFGAANGVDGSNTLYLLCRGFSGLWIESSETNVQSIRERFQGHVENGRLQVVQSFLTAENIEDILLANLGQDERIALLSIDVDGNDFWIWKAIKKIRPAVIVVEYNPTFPPPVSLVQEYKPDHVWGGTNYGGASIEALARLGRQKGYQLVGCNVTGVNAFFVRDDLVGEHFPYALTAANLYHPPRVYLTFGCFTSAGGIPDFGKYIEIE